MPLKALYGVAGLGPTQLAKALTNVSGGCAVVIQNKLYKTGPLPACPSVIFAGLHQFFKHHARVTKAHIAFIIDAPERLETIQGLLGLGYLKLKSGHYAYTGLQEPQLLTCLEEAKSPDKVTWTHKPINRLSEFIQDDKTDSVMNQLRSLMYAVPNKEARAVVTTAIFRFLVGKKKLGSVISNAQQHLGPKTCAKIRKLLMSGNGKELRVAYAKYKAKPSKADKICKAHKVSMFTLRYLEAKAKQ